MASGQRVRLGSEECGVLRRIWSNAAMTSQDATLYGSTFACPCGKTHTIRPERIIYDRDALTQLGPLARQHAKGDSASVVYDARTAAVAGVAAADALAGEGFRVKRVLLADPKPGHSPVCDDLTFATLTQQVGWADVIVPVGSGVISDFGKMLADERKVASICVATAGSMNGYASANVALTVGGLKTLLHSNAAAAVLARPDDIANAPYEMTVAGLGDVLAKPVSSADWRMNHLLFGDYYCQRSVDLIAQIEPKYLNDPLGILARRPESIAALFEALLLTGVAMTMAESSAPASGGEHMISHTLDMKSHLLGRQHDLHGRQVGVGTTLAAEIYRRVLAIDSPRWRLSDRGVDGGFWGPLADAARQEYQAKVPRLGRAVESLSHGGTWDALRRELSPMLHGPEKIHNCLAQARGATKAADLGCTKDLLLECLLHAHEFRSRFTILDLAILAGVLPGQAGEIVEQWA